MAKIRFIPEEIINKLRHPDVLLGQGKTVAEIVKVPGITDVTYYRWRQEYGGTATTPPPIPPKIQQPGANDSKSLHRACHEEGRCFPR